MDNLIINQLCLFFISPILMSLNSDLMSHQEWNSVLHAHFNNHIYFFRPKSLDYTERKHICGVILAFLPKA